MVTLSEMMPMVDNAIDAAFGERVVITAMKESEYAAGVPDTGIPPFQLIGIANVDGSVTAVSGTRYKAKQDASMVGARAEISFKESDFSVIRPIPRKDWKVTLIDRKTAPTFRVSYSRLDGHGRVHCIVEPETK